MAGAERTTIEEVVRKVLRDEHGDVTTSGDLTLVGPGAKRSRVRVPPAPSHNSP